MYLFSLAVQPVISAEWLMRDVSLSWQPPQKLDSNNVVNCYLSLIAISCTTVQARSLSTDVNAGVSETRD